VSRCQLGGTPTAVHLSFLDRRGYIFFQPVPHLSSKRAAWTLFQTHRYSENLVTPVIEPGTSGSVTMCSEHNRCSRFYRAYYEIQNQSVQTMRLQLHNTLGSRLAIYLNEIVFLDNCFYAILYHDWYVPLFGTLCSQTNSVALSPQANYTD
jgi:hypothetical protein